MTKHITHRRVNILLTIIVCLLGAYLLVLPIVPNLQFALQDNKPLPAIATPEVRPDQFPADNRLVIPSIRLNETILSGEDESTVNKGVWHKPNSTTPNEVGNSVIVGHRFTYSPQIKDPFYHLDKVITGDDVYIYWGVSEFTTGLLKKKWYPRRL